MEYKTEENSNNVGNLEANNSNNTDSNTVNKELDDKTINTQEDNNNFDNKNEQNTNNYIKLSPLSIEFPELQTRLIEEMLFFLYENNLCHFNKYKAINHYDISVYPNSFSKQLFDKAKFYNLALQKSIALISSKYYLKVTNLCNKFFKDIESKDTQFSSIDKLLNAANSLIEQYNNNNINNCKNNNQSNINYYFTKPSTLLINENVYSIDKIKKFIYYNKHDVQPDNIYFSDNQFYSYFSNKYKYYYNISALKDPTVFYYDKTCTSQDSLELLIESILEAMRIFCVDIDNNSINDRNQIILNNYYSELSNMKSVFENDKNIKLEEYEKKKQKYEAEGLDIPEEEILNVEDLENLFNEKLKKICPYPTLSTTTDKQLDYKYTMVLFVCEEDNENNKQEQITIINELFSKYNIYAIKISLSELNELYELNYAKIDEKNNLVINDKIVSVIIYKIDLFNSINETNYKIYSMLESSSAITSPNVFATLGSILPINMLLLRNKEFNNYFNEEELSADVQRFIPKIIYPDDYLESRNNEKTNDSIYCIDNYKSIKNDILDNKNNYKCIDINKYISNSNEKVDIDDNLNNIENECKNSNIIVLENNNRYPVVNSTILRNETIIKGSFTSKLSIYGVSIIKKDNFQVVRNKNIGILSKLYECDINGAVIDDSNYAIDIPLLRDDFNIKDIEEIIY